MPIDSDGIVPLMKMAVRSTLECGSSSYRLSSYAPCTLAELTDGGKAVSAATALQGASHIAFSSSYRRR